MSQQVFRQEAIDYHVGDRAEGEVLRILPGWARWTYCLLLSLVAATVVFSLFGRVSEYTEGPALIRADARLVLVAPMPGVVAWVGPLGGTHVRQGDELVQFQLMDKSGRVVDMQRQFQEALARLLLNPTDAAARRTLRALRLEREAVSLPVEAWTLRAPSAGTVGEVRVRPGQPVVPGDSLLSIVPAGTGYSAIALFPREHESRLRVGLTLHLRIVDHPYAHQHLVIDSIGEDVLGVSDAISLLRSTSGGLRPPSGLTVAVRARLPSETFRTGDHSQGYTDGMRAVAGVRVRWDSVLSALVPTLKGRLSGR